MLNLCRRAMPPIALAFLLIFGFDLRVGATPINMQVTGVNGAETDGIYVDPYYGRVNNVSAILYCDDFAHDTTIN